MPLAIWFSYFLEQAKKYAKEEVEKSRENEDEYYIDENNKKKKLKQSYSGKWIKKFSNDLLYEIITRKNVVGKRGTKTVFKNAELPKEIKQRFPEAITFGKEDMTSEEYRKAIVLLFSYYVWYKAEYIQRDYGFDDYYYELDDLLDKCNLPNLYFGNPFDWLFLFCSQDESPLYIFREILSKALPKD